MKIERLTETECLDTLASMGFGRLACARDNQPYVVPIYFATGDNCLYSFALPGQKIDWMRENPLVCIEADTVSSGDDWISVVVFGRYRELTDDADSRAERELAHRRLQGRPMWWEPGATSREGHAGVGGHAPIFYRVSINGLTGYRGLRGERQSQSR